MKVDKAELSQKIGKLKGVVPKKSNTPVMQSILVKDGYLIGSNQELTVQAKLEGAESESFLIPAKAFDLIQNLPDGEVEITSDTDHVITIKAGKIKNTFASMDPKLFNVIEESKEEYTTMTVDSKELKECMSHGRYMDDSYLIHESKEYLRYCLREICKKCEELKIEINMKKTRIVKLSRGFQFLKTHFWLTETGKVIKKPCHDAIVRQRRKMKRQKRLLDRGELSFEDIKCSYSSWRGSLQNKNARMAIRSMDKLFDSLFIDSWKGGMEDGE